MLIDPRVGTDLSGLLFLLLSVPVLVMIHEAGHALAAPLSGYRVTSFGVGLGRPLLRWETRRGTVLYVAPWLFTGACVAIPSRLRGGGVLFHLGGILAQAALAVLLWGPARRLPMVAALEWLNLAVLGWNLLPWRWRGQASDGWWLLQRLLGRARRGLPLPGPRPVLERVRAFEERVGATVGTFYAGLGLAWLDVLEDPAGEGRAALLDAPPPAAVLLGNDFLPGLFGFLLAERARHRGRPGEGLERLSWLRKVALPEPATESADLLDLAEARLRLVRGEAAAARRILGRLAGVRDPVGLEALAIHVEAALQEDDPEELEAVAVRLADRSDGPFLAPVDAARSLQAASRRLLDRGRESAGRRVGRAGRTVGLGLVAWAAPGSRAGLMGRLGLLPEPAEVSALAPSTGRGMGSSPPSPSRGP